MCVGTLLSILHVLFHLSSFQQSLEGHIIIPIL